MYLPDWIKRAGEFLAAAGGPTRADTYTLTVSIEHPTNGNMIAYGVFDKMQGGEQSSTTTKYRPGSMGPPIDIGGQTEVSDVTIQRLYKLERDHDVMGQLYECEKRNSKMVVTKQPRTIEGQLYGSPIVYRGRLKTVTAPDVDSETATAALLSLVMSVEGYPAA